jgi:hypothetical protein
MNMNSISSPLSSSYNSNNALGDNFFYILPRAIIRDLILREMLDLKDIARLEVAAAIHRLHEEEKVSVEMLIS